MTTESTSIATISEIDRAIANLQNINTIPDARKLIALAQGYVVTARKLYKASDINTINEANDDKGKALDIAKKGGELRLFAEARLGELIKAEQEAGRLATSARHPGQFVGNNDVTDGLKTLSDYGLTKIESHRAQELAEHKDVIAKVIVDSLDIPTRAAVAREINQQERKDNQKASILNFPDGIFDVIYADPPWQYDNLGVIATADNHYPTMALNDICNLHVPSADNAVLFLWVTNPFLRDAFKVIDAWGFEYKTNIVWVKTDLKKPGIGFYVRGRHELLFICTKGSCLPDKNISPISSVIESPIQAHSKKPQEVYEIIETLYPGHKYLELFAREKRQGWTPFGNQL